MLITVLLDSKKQVLSRTTENCTVYRLTLRRLNNSAPHFGPLLPSLLYNTLTPQYTSKCARINAQWITECEWRDNEGCLPARSITRPRFKIRKCLLYVRVCVRCREAKLLSPECTKRLLRTSLKKRTPNHNGEREREMKGERSGWTSARTVLFRSGHGQWMLVLVGRGGGQMREGERERSEGREWWKRTEGKENENAPEHQRPRALYAAWSHCSAVGIIGRASLSFGPRCAALRRERCGRSSLQSSFLLL